jgi:hypothetical protein
LIFCTCWTLGGQSSGQHRKSPVSLLPIIRLTCPVNPRSGNPRNCWVFPIVVLLQKFFGSDSAEPWHCATLTCDLDQGAAGGCILCSWTPPYIDCGQEASVATTCRSSLNEFLDHCTCQCCFMAVSGLAAHRVPTYHPRHNKRNAALRAFSIGDILVDRHGGSKP